MNTQSDNAINELKAGQNAKVVMVLPVDQVIPDPEQPRKFFDEDKIKGLAQSIENTGQDTPITVYDNGDDYVIISGERRWRACQLISSKTVQAIEVESIEDIGLLRVKQIVENIQREEFKPLDLARAYSQLLSDENGKYKTVAALAVDLGISEASVHRTLKVIDMPDDVQALVASGAASIDTAHDLTAIAKQDEPAAAALIEKATETGTVKREETRQVKQDLKIRANQGKQKGANADLRSLLSDASKLISKGHFTSASSLIKKALDKCDSLASK